MLCFDAYNIFYNDGFILFLFSFSLKCDYTKNATQLNTHTLHNTGPDFDKP